MLIEIFLSLFYTGIFIFVIFRWRFFCFDGISKTELSAVFIIKILSGVALTLIYTFYYTERSEADIFKYFDDSKYIFESLFINPIHYLQLTFGINSEASHLQIYTEGTQYWAVQTEAYQKFMATENLNFFNAHRLITRFNAIVRLFSFGYFSVHTIFMCFISLCGLTALFKTFYPFLKNYRYTLIVGIFFLPSVLFWSSGVLKEGFIFLTLGIFFYAFFNVNKKKNIVCNVLLLICAALLLAIIKYYILFSIIPAAIAFMLSEKYFIKRKLSPYLLVYGFIAAYLTLVSFTENMLPNPLKFLAHKQSEQIKEAQGGSFCIYNDGQNKEFVYFTPDTKLEKQVIDSSRQIFSLQHGITAFKYKEGQLTGESFVVSEKINEGAYFYEISSKPTAGSYILIPELEPDILSFLKVLPSALYNVMLRPHLGEIKTVMLIPGAIENLIIFIFIIFCIIRISIPNDNLNLILFLLISTLSLYIIIGITTPVLGNIIRYKAPFLPFLIIAGLLMISKPIQKVKPNPE